MNYKKNQIQELLKGKSDKNIAVIESLLRSDLKNCKDIVQKHSGGAKEFSLIIITK